MRYAFELARRDRQRYVHCVTKSNALANVMELWDEVFAEVAGEYPDVRTTRSHVDSSSMYLISRPADFDVLVATNLMGDILSDEAALTRLQEHRPEASANLNPEGGVPGMFEPVHGSAPDIAGKGIANPLSRDPGRGPAGTPRRAGGAARLVEDAVRMPPWPGAEGGRRTWGAALHGRRSQRRPSWRRLYSTAAPGSGG